jgi:hypothetical protein
MMASAILSDTILCERLSIQETTPTVAAAIESEPLTKLERDRSDFNYLKTAVSI